MTQHHANTELLPLVVLISGEGTNLQAILDQCARGILPASVRAVISNRADAPGLRRAIAANIPVHVILATEKTDRYEYDAALTAVIERYPPGLVLLAGFMRILSDGFVQHYRGRLLNIHPALLPKYRGIHTHRRVLEAGDKEHGCSVHFVTKELDSGPVIAQAKVSVRPGDTEKTLSVRVKEREHVLYPLAVRWFAEGQVKLAANHVVFDGKPVDQPRVFDANEDMK
ncbi:MAG: phosphoribosylglycinamide formyltransferase [Gammaproteobacteria bacterium]